MIKQLNRPEAELRYRSLIKGALAGHPDLSEWWLQRVPTPASFRNLSTDQLQELAQHDLPRLAPMLSAIEAGQVILKSPRDYWGQAYSSQMVGGDLIDYFASNEQEQVVLLCTDIRNEIIHVKTLFSGGTSECVLYPDLILREAIQNCASGIIIAHNHPTGRTHPSEADEQFCQRMDQAAQLIGIPLLDFLVVGNTDYYSWREDLNGGKV